MSQTTYQLFRYPIESCTDLEELNAFLAGHPVVSCRQHLVESQGRAWLVFVVETASSTKTPRRSRAKAPDLTELPPEERTVYNRLRDLRKALANEGGIPAYSVFSNEQLVAIVKARPAAVSDLSVVPGLGSSRIEKFGTAVVEVCRDVFLQNASEETSP